MFSSGILGAPGGSHNPMKDFEVQQPPDDSISKIVFSSAVQTSNYLVASSWDNNVSSIRSHGSVLLINSIASIGGIFCVE